MTEYTKLSELTHHVVLANCALAQGAPAWRPRIELRLFASPRVLVLCGIASALLWPCKLVPSGASYACALAQALLRPALTEAANRLPQRTCVCVDDVIAYATLEGQGEALTDAANRLPRGTDMCVWMM